jgi:hypothetical protein
LIAAPTLDQFGRPVQLPLVEPKLARLELQVQPAKLVSFGPLTAPTKLVCTKNEVLAGSRS